MKCRACEKTLVNFWFTDITNMRVNPMVFICTNGECPTFGLLTVAGIPDDEDKLKIKKRPTND